MKNVITETTKKQTRITLAKTCAITTNSSNSESPKWPHGASIKDLIVRAEHERVRTGDKIPYPLLKAIIRLAFSFSGSQVTISRTAELADIVNVLANSRSDQDRLTQLLANWHSSKEDDVPVTKLRLLRNPSYDEKVVLNLTLAVQLAVQCGEITKIYANIDQCYGEFCAFAESCDADSLHACSQLIEAHCDYERLSEELKVARRVLDKKFSLKQLAKRLYLDWQFERARKRYQQAKRDVKISCCELPNVNDAIASGRTLMATLQLLQGQMNTLYKMANVAFGAPEVKIEHCLPELNGITQFLGFTDNSIDETSSISGVWVQEVFKNRTDPRCISDLTREIEKFCE